MLQSGQNLLAGNRPTKRELSSVFNYLDDVKPVTIPEREYIKHEEDLVTLCPGVDDSLLQQWIEACLHVIQGRVKLAHVRIGSFQHVVFTLTCHSISSHPRSDTGSHGPK